jgi:hypothetical protein
VRASLGFGSTHADCDALVNFLSTAYLHKAPKALSSYIPRVGIKEGEGAKREGQAVLETGLDRADGSNSNSNSTSSSSSSSSCSGSTSTSANTSASSTVSSVSREVQDMCLYPLIRNGEPSPALADRISREAKEAGAKVSLLSAIFVYPIKSCAGFRVERWPLCPSGLFLDRCWMVVDAASGAALTQKAHPRLSLVQPSVDLERGLLTIAAPGFAQVLVVPIFDVSQGGNEEEKAESEADGEVEMDREVARGTACSTKSKSDREQCHDSACGRGTVRVCGREHTGLFVSSDANEWFSRFLSGPHPSSSGEKHRKRTVVDAGGVEEVENGVEEKEGVQDEEGAEISERVVKARFVRTAHVLSSSSSSSSSSFSSSASSTSLSTHEEPKSRAASFSNTAPFLLISLDSVNALDCMMAEKEREREREREREGEVNADGAPSFTSVVSNTGASSTTSSNSATSSSGASSSGASSSGASSSGASSSGASSSGASSSGASSSGASSISTTGIRVESFRPNFLVCSPRGDGQPHEEVRCSFNYEV